MNSSPDNFSDRYDPAEYRVRLFLSVDLSGSTAYKNSAAGINRSNGATPEWVDVFQKFYTDFPDMYKSEYQQQHNVAVGSDGCPQLWKAVGDELIFCGRISNEKAGAFALSTFIDTLHTYREKLCSSGIALNVKGAGWLAAFPEPNRAIQLRRVNGLPDLFSASEALERHADQNPFDYDFLGKAIDTGFRVASAAKPERLVLSVQLALLLVKVPQGFGLGHDIRFDRPRSLKGVNKDQPYPMLYIDTMTHLPTEEIQKKERHLLREEAPPTRDLLAEYLEAYCQVVGTDEIMLPADANGTETAVPESYTNLKGMIAAHLSQEPDREFDGNGGDEAVQEDGVEEILDEENLTPLPADDDG